MERYHERQSEHHDGDDILQAYENLAEDHLGPVAEGSLDYINRLVRGNLDSGDDSGKQPGRGNEAQAGENCSGGEIVLKHNPSAEHRRELVLEEECKPQAYEEGQQHDENRFAYELADYLPGTAAQQPSGSHLFGSHTGIGHGEVDIVGDSEEEDGDDGAEQYDQQTLVALFQPKAVVLGIEHHFAQGSETCCGFSDVYVEPHHRHSIVEV